MGDPITSSGAAELRGIREMPLPLFADLQVPGILVEVGFLSNPAEEQQLGTEAYQRRLANQIAEGIAKAKQDAQP